MAAASINIDANSLVEQAQRDLWNRLSEEQQQQFLFQTASNLPSNGLNINPTASLVRQVPRSMSYMTPVITQTPTPDSSFMDRTYSAPTFNHNFDSNLLNQRSISATTSWQPLSEEQTGNHYTLSSQSATISATSPLQTSNESSLYVNNDIEEWTPEQYINAYIKPSSTSPLPLPHNQQTDRLQVQLTQNTMQWSPSFDGSNSPSTPSTVAPMTPTLSSSSMSRDSSSNPKFSDNVMMRVGSNFSDFHPLLSEDGTFPMSSDSSKPISVVADSSHFLTSFTGSSNEDLYSPAHVSVGASALTSPSSNSLDLAEDMRRSASASSDSNSSNASAPSTSSRQLRREREINALASRKIAPKAIESNDETSSAPSNGQMVRVRSQDGSSKEMGVLPKAHYIRPQHPKIMCPHCNKHPTGFRGTHELDRHIARAHSKYRKAFICIDASINKKFLANCKHCRNKKEYGAYYNAAAHLRRAHFHPRKRGRKGKNDQKRGGSGGGDDPPMDFLRQHWIKEIEVANEPDSSLNDANDACDDVEESFEFNDSAASYPTELTNDASNMSDYQFFENSVFMNSNDVAAFGSIPQSDPNNFYFDADVNVYMSQ